MIYIGEVAAVVASSNLFGFLRGILHLFSCWIDYMGYATVHYCQVMVIAFMGGLEAMMLIVNLRDGGIAQA